jgi:DNA-binding HxlR family transcriptional regulator
VTELLPDSGIFDSYLNEILNWVLPGSVDMSRPDQTAGEIDRVRKRLNVLTQETRFSLIQDILGHPEQLPTLKELDYVNPSRSQTTIRQHLQELVNAGVVAEVSLPKDQRQNDLPYKFYGLSEDGREFLTEHGLFRAEETLTEIYNNIEKTETVQRYETAPRPER